MHPPIHRTKNHFLNLIIFIGLLSGTLVTALIWLKVPNQIIATLSWLCIGLIGLRSFWYFRHSKASRSPSVMILAILAAVSLLYLFPELFGPACGGMPRAFAMKCPPECETEKCIHWEAGPSEACPKPGKGGGCCLESVITCDSDCEAPPPPDLPPTITGSFVCSQWGDNNWCVNTATLEITANEPQGKQLQVSGDVGSVPFACPTGIGSINCSVPLSEGKTTVNYLATSITGLTASGSNLYQYDATQPKIDGTLSGIPGANGWYVSSVDISASASDPGSGSGLAVFSYNWNDTGWEPYSGPLSFTDGVHSLSLRASDVAGNVVETNQTIQIDTITPALSVSAVGTVGTNGWYSSNVQVDVAATDSGSGLGVFEYDLNSEGWTTYTDPFELTDGVYTLNLHASDNAGNLSEGTQILSVDTLAPSIDLSVIGTEGAKGWYTSTVQVSASASDTVSGLSVLEVSVDNGVWNSYSVPLEFDDGVHTYQFRATDRAGNITTTTLKQVLIDTIPPVVVLPESWELGQTVLFELQDDGSGLASVRLVIEDEEERYPKVTWDESIGSYKFHGDIHWDGRFKDGQLAPAGGEYYAWLKVSDNAGNESRLAGQIEVPLKSLVSELIQPAGDQSGGLVSGTEASEPVVEVSVPQLTGSITTSDHQPTINILPPISFGGENNGAIQQSNTQAEKASFNAGGLSSSPTTNSQSNLLWGATATAAIGAFAAEIARKKVKEKAEQAAKRRENRETSDFRQKAKASKMAQLEARWAAAKQAAQIRAEIARTRILGQKDVGTEIEMRSHLTKAQAQREATEHAKKKAYEVYRAQEVATQTKITPPKEAAKKPFISWFEERITQTALSPSLGRYGVGTQAIGDSLHSIGDPSRNPRTAETHNQMWAGIAAWNAIFNMRKEAKEFTTQAIKGGRWSDAFRGISTLAKQNLAIAAGTVAATGIAVWGVVTTPIRIFTHDIPEFARAGKERMEGKDRFWDVIFTGTNLVGDVTALYGGYQAAGRMNIVNKINSAAADQFGIGITKRTYIFEGTEYIYRYNPYKKTALGYLEDLKGLPPKEFNYLNDVPKEIYDNTNIQFDFLLDIENSKIKPKYFSDPTQYEKRVFSYVEHRYVENIVTEPNAWTSNFRVRWKALTNGLLTQFQKR